MRYSIQVEIDTTEIQDAALLATHLNAGAATDFLAADAKAHLSKLIRDAELRYLIAEGLARYKERHPAPAA